jgi:hypothetical protein
MYGMITASRLGDGVVVFQDAKGDWTEDFNLGAVLATEAEKVAALALAERAQAENEIVDAYWIELERRAGHYVPKALREMIRASGPTVRRDLGKQAVGLAPSLAQRTPRETSHVSL